MPWGLRRYQEAGDLHFIGFSCFHRLPLLNGEAKQEVFERSLESTRRQYRFCVYGYVVMPEHLHMIVSEPERKRLWTAMHP